MRRSYGTAAQAKDKSRPLDLLSDVRARMRKKSVLAYGRRCVHAYVDTLRTFACARVGSYQLQSTVFHIIRVPELLDRVAIHILYHLGVKL